jgi:hypothetical protein
MPGAVISKRPPFAKKARIYRSEAGYVYHLSFAALRWLPNEASSAHRVESLLLG